MMIIKKRVQYVTAVYSANIDIVQVSKNSENEESICKVE